MPSAHALSNYTNDILPEEFGAPGIVSVEGGQRAVRRYQALPTLGDEWSSEGTLGALIATAEKEREVGVTHFPRRNEARTTLVTRRNCRWKQMQWYTLLGEVGGELDVRCRVVSWRRRLLRGLLGPSLFVCRGLLRSA